MVGPVHCYTLELGDELILFDTGPPTEAGRTFLREHLDLSRLTRVIVTHSHIDHCGQAAWLAENSGAVIYLPRLDILKYERSDLRLARLFALLAGLGFAESYIEVLLERFTRASEPLRFPETCRVAEEELPPHLGVEVLGCPGHSQTDLIYTGNGWAVTGDTLLRGVFQSPLLDVDLETGDRFRNYQAYCSTIVKLAGLRSKHILPGHRQHVDSVDQTLLFYLNKMLHRVDHLLPHLSDLPVPEVIGEVFPAMDDVFHIYLKASEIIFMKDFLANPTMLLSALEKIGLYQPLSEQFLKVTEKQ